MRSPHTSEVLRRWWFNDWVKYLELIQENRVFLLLALKWKVDFGLVWNPFPTIDANPKQEGYYCFFLLSVQFGSFVR